MLEIKEKETINKMDTLELILKYLLYCLLSFLCDLPLMLIVWFLAKDYYKNKWNGNKRPPDWCYYPIFDHGFEYNVVKPLEEALGFELFTWQKSYLLNGEYRRYGDSTAKALKILLEVNKPPLNVSHPTSHRQKSEICTLRDIKEKLDAAGIPTRDIIFK